MTLYKNEYTSDPMKREQHEAVRNTVGWFYFTHQLLEVTGKDAPTFLDWIFVNTIGKTKVGGAKYTTMLNDDGNIIDDVVVFRLEENKFWISTLYINKLIAWIDAHKGNDNVVYNNISRSTDMYSVQGPKSRELLNTILAENIDDQKFFTIRDNKIDNVPVKVSRTGYTGELGYEIYVASESKALVEEKLTEYGKPFGAVQVSEFQVMVWTLPTEKGYNLMGDIGNINPLEIDINTKIDWTKEFIGKAALEKVKEEGAKRRLLGFVLEEEDVHIPGKHKGSCGEPVIMNGETVGRVTKETYGFTVEKNIGFALVDSRKAKIGDRVTINGYSATLTERIWYDVENKRPLGK